MDIASKFEQIAKIENTHAQRFKSLLNDFEDDTIYTGKSEDIWICTNCGHIHNGKEAPPACPVCGKQRGYFLNKMYFTII